jgi:restriction endonuclease S subunit
MNLLSSSPLIWAVDEINDKLGADYYHPYYRDLLRTLEEVKYPLLTIDDISSQKVTKGESPLWRGYNYVSKGIPFLRIINIKNGLVKLEEVVYISPEVHNQMKRSQLNPGNILLTMAGTLGCAAVVPTYLKVGNINQDLAKISLKDEITVNNKKVKLDPYYIAAFLNTKFCNIQIEISHIGLTRKHINLPDIGRIKVPIPSEDIQLPIGNKIKNAEILERKASALQNELEKNISEKMHLGNIGERFTTFFIIEEGQLLERIDPEFYHYRYLISKILSSYPYEKRQLGEIVTFSFKKANPKKEPWKKFRYIEISDVNPNTGEIESWSDIIGVEAPGRARMILKTGNVILSSLKGSLRSIAIVPPELDNSIGTTGFFVLKPKEEIINKESLWWMLRTDVCQRQLEQIASGAIMPAINEQELKKVTIPIPPPDIQKEIKENVEEIQRLRREANSLVKGAIRDVEDLIESTK